MNSNRQHMESEYFVDVVDGDDISLLDRKRNNFPVIVETNNVAIKADLKQGDIIRAKIYSDKIDGHTMLWHFEEIEKVKSK